MGCRLDGGVIGTGGDGRGGIGDGGDIEELIKSEDERNKPIITGGLFGRGSFRGVIHSKKFRTQL